MAGANMARVNLDCIQEKLVNGKKTKKVINFLIVLSRATTTKTTKHKHKLIKHCQENKTNKHKHKQIKHCQEGDKFPHSFISSYNK